ncbi:MAG: pantetheine-phosphate adenylyltransferase [Rhodospirillaceae bacterium]|nr:pantetheine-phosphate adenylyltransferase [Rhodospirillaceae bacterium]
MPRTGVYPGTFDPVTNGHMDIISRATRVVGQLIIGVAINAGKGPLFSLEERVAMVEHEISLLPDGAGERVNVQPFEGLLTDFAVSCGASLIVRGLRAVSDFEYEFQMTGMNRRLNPEIETVFLTASEKHQFISSALVKEIGSMGGDITHFVATNVREKLLEKFSG